MGLDLTRPVQTKGGLPARLACTDCKCIAGDDLCILCLVDMGGEEFDIWCDIDGHTNTGDDDDDIINVPRRIQGYAHIYRATNRDGWYIGCFEPSLGDFLPSATEKAVARVRIDIEEGTFDD